MIALFACTLWLCAPEPLIPTLPSLAACHVKARAMAVPGVMYRCLENRR